MGLGGACAALDPAGSGGQQKKKAERKEGDGRAVEIHGFSSHLSSLLVVAVFSALRLPSRSFPLQLVSQWLLQSDSSTLRHLQCAP